LQRRLEGGADYLRYYSDRLLASPLATLEQLAGHIRQHTPDVIDLGSGAPRFDLVPAVTTRLSPDQRGWPDLAGLPELRGEVATKLFSDNRLAVSPAEEILITQGAIGAAHTILDAFVNRGDSVALFDPVSPMYPLLVRTRGAKIRWISTGVEEGRLRVRFDHLARALRGAKLLVINSPANPTGAVLAAEDLEQIAWWANRQDVLVLSDEVFERFVYDAPLTSLATLPLAQARTLTVGSVSKSHALVAARVGWIAGHRHLLRACKATAALRTPFVSLLSQLQALHALRTSPDAFAPIQANMESRRRFVHDRLRAMGLETPSPTGGFFYWVSVPRQHGTGQAFAETLLTTQRVRVLPGDLFGPSGRHHIRLSFVAEDGRLEEGLNRLAAMVQGTTPNVRRAA
jgi:aspartate/methionine/tyrosine aminotransferase